ncbi:MULTISPECIES: glycine zipper 2TM domain-containing protein [Ramlibacter]|uniref:Glycine zipper 2TM domain-containing protein n=1 Tax=Ramlibacter pinisoli TaxID=2682844 RepID=A0A6N8IN32_9BURK|nr:MULTISPECIES: glycine zipper 2TM domain-containing protein [Ramlibacter]MBA2960645.1 glycine zipper 2TM domain-containing protein [Ramlibacter sp. CGMCC 1.13660]MVQ27975.1 glycine zipper 2TM domain-containing protein [Ramlibacter pinisoli]
MNIKPPTLAALLLALCTAGAPALVQASEAGKHKAALAHCSDCGTVQAVTKEKRKGEGGAVGIVAGAAAGGLLGNQVGGGTGKALATVGGAVAGGFVGNEVQKHVTSKEVWVTKVKLKDGSVRTFEQEQAPAWKTGAVVQVRGKSLASL